MIQRQPLISVAMATFNGVRFLATQLDSILNQSHQNIEVVIGDDGSTDGTLAVLDQYAGHYSNVTYYVNEKRLGYVHNFEQVIAACRGDYIALADQDDLWEPDKLKILLALIGARSAIFSDASLMDAEGRIYADSYMRHARKNASDVDDLEHYIFENLTQGCTLLFTRELKNQILPFEDHTPGHDWLIGLVARSGGGLGYVSQPLVRYRQHQNNVTGVRGALSFCRYIFDLNARRRVLKNTLEMSKILLKLNAVKNADEHLLLERIKLESERVIALKPRLSTLLFLGRRVIKVVLKKLVIGF